MGDAGGKICHKMYIQRCVVVLRLIKNLLALYGNRVHSSEQLVCSYRYNEHISLKQELIWILKTHPEL